METQGGDTCHLFLAFSGAYVDQNKFDTWHCMNTKDGIVRMLTWPNDRPTHGSMDDMW
jgi:hypothetical protein